MKKLFVLFMVGLFLLWVPGRGIDASGKEVSPVMEKEFKKEVDNTRNLSQIRKIVWNITGETGNVEIMAEGEVETIIRKVDGELVIELHGVECSGDLVLPAVKEGNFLKEVKYDLDNPEEVRIRMIVSKMVNHTIDVSSDRRSIIVRFSQSLLAGKKIVLDPGHGGEDDGARGRQGTREKEMNLEIMLRLKELLEESGAWVTLTRTGDYFVGLYERAFFANYLGGDLFVSVHANSHPNPEVRGIEVFSYPGKTESKKFASHILGQLTESTGFTKLGVKQGDFVVIRETQMPSVLVEVGFLSNLDEEMILKTGEFRENAALGIFKGICDYYRGMKEDLKG